MKISWSGCLPSQLWTCLAQQLANDNEKQMADQNDNEVGNVCLEFAQEKEREGKTSMLELKGGSIGKVRTIFLLFMFLLFLLSISLLPRTMLDTSAY